LLRIPGPSLSKKFEAFSKSFGKDRVDRLNSGGSSDLASEGSCDRLGLGKLDLNHDD